MAGCLWELSAGGDSEVMIARARNIAQSPCPLPCCSATPPPSLDPQTDPCLREAAAGTARWQPGLAVVSGWRLLARHWRLWSGPGQQLPEPQNWPRRHPFAVNWREASVSSPTDNCPSISRGRTHLQPDRGEHGGDHLPAQRRHGNPAVPCTAGVSCALTESDLDFLLAQASGTRSLRLPTVRDPCR